MAEQHNLRRLGAPLRSILDLVYPEICPLCMLRLHPTEQILCEPCRAQILTEDTWRCEFCGATGIPPSPREGEPCPQCPPLGAPYQGVLAAVHYHSVSAQCVYRFKYHGRLEIGNLIADMMITRLSEPINELRGRIDWIVPVPLHWRRRWSRGFNQSDLLANRLGQHLGIPVVHVLRRKRHTRMQTRIPREHRARNVAGAFEVQRSAPRELPGILLIDDVVTTGHTITECARALQLHGAPQIWVACFARAGKTNSTETHQTDV